MTKKTIRAEVAGRVKNLSPVYCREADAAICRCVTQSALYRNARTILCYVGTAREIDTSALLHAALEDGKTLVLPLCVEKGVMEARQIAGLGDLVSGRYGILAPRLDCPRLEPEAIDLAVVPCCAAGNDGRRLVYGGGYYHLYLHSTVSTAIVLCRGQLVREGLPVEAHDVPMDYLATEKGLTACQRA